MSLASRVTPSDSLDGPPILRQNLKALTATVYRIFDDIRYEIPISEDGVVLDWEPLRQAFEILLSVPGPSSTDECPLKVSADLQTNKDLRVSESADDQAVREIHGQLEKISDQILPEIRTGDPSLLISNAISAISALENYSGVIVEVKRGLRRPTEAKTYGHRTDVTAAEKLRNTTSTDLGRFDAEAAESVNRQIRAILEKSIPDALGILPSDKARSEALQTLSTIFNSRISYKNGLPSCLDRDAHTAFLHNLRDMALRLSEFSEDTPIRSVVTLVDAAILVDCAGSLVDVLSVLETSLPTVHLRLLYPGGNG